MTKEEKWEAIRSDLGEVMNRHCVDSTTDVPDFILAQYIERTLNALFFFFIEMNEWENKSDRNTYEDDGK